MRARPRTTIACVAGFVIVTAAIAAALAGSGPRVAARLPMIDVRSGDIRWVSVRARAVSVPAVNPESGERTLVGAERGPDGCWRILPQDLELMNGMEGSISPRIDRVSGVVRASGETDS